MAPGKSRRPKHKQARAAQVTPVRVTPTQGTPRVGSVAPAPKVRTTRWRWVLAIILVAAVVAFSSAIDAPFQFDDVASIPGNPTIDQLSTALSPPSGGLAVSGRPIANLSLAVNRALNEAFGPAGGAASHATVGYHVGNILLHLLCGLLLFGIVRRTILFGRVVAEWADDADGIALAVTTLWLLHPIQTDAVDYIVQRTELLVSLFYVATLYASIRAWDATSQRRRLGWYVLSFVSCLLGMGSKEVMVSAPLIVMLHDRAFRAESWKALIAGPRARLWFYLALLATAGWLVVLVASGARDTTAGFGHGLSSFQYLYTQAWAIARYLRLLFWPSGLTYDYGQAPVSGLGGVPGAILLLPLGAATIVAWTRDRWRWCGFAGAWFFLLLGPSSSFVPVRTEIAAERRVYLASAAIVLMVVVGVVALLRRSRLVQPKRSGRFGMLARGAVVAVAAVLVVVTFDRGRLYRSPEALWRDAIAKRPDNPRAYDNLAAVLLQGPGDTTRRADAEQLYRRAIVLDSTYLSAWTNLADIQLSSGRTGEARATLEHVLRIEPRYVDANARLGGVLVKQGDLARGIPMLERAAGVTPTDELYVTLATAYMQAGRTADALNALARAVELNPGRADAAGYLGVHLAEDGRPDQAIPYLETAARVPGAPAIVLALLSLSYAQMGNVSGAQSAGALAEQRAGKDERVYLTVGRAMLLVNRAADAARLFSDGVRLAPDDPEAITRLGIAKAAGGDNASAERLFRQALALTPDYGPAKQAMAQLRSGR